jgi:hypothetical protein
VGLALATRPETSLPPETPPAVPPGPRRRAWAVVRRLGPATAILGVAAAAWLYLGGGYPGLDTAYAVVWGDELVHGALPEYVLETAPTPTPHPLATALGALAALLGGGAYDALAALAYLSFGALVWGVYALGRECYSWRVGALGAVLVATSFTILSRTASSYFDGVVVALILFAALLEASGRRGAPVLLLLAVAGLQRPEAWLLSAGYWLYLARHLENRERLRLAAIAAAAPIVWGAVDLIVTGDPFFSFTGTRSAVEEATRGGGGGGGESPSVLSITVEDLRAILRLPTLVGGAVGCVLALAFLRARSWVPLSLLAFGLFTFVGLGLGGLPLADRFLFLPAAVLAIFFGVAVAGWRDDPDLGRSSARARRFRLAWMAGAVALVIGLIVSLPAQGDRLERLREAVDLRVRAVDDLRSLADSERGGAVMRRCEHVYVPNHELVPILSYALERPPRDVIPIGPQQPGRGAYLEPLGAVVAVDAFHLRTRAILDIPAGFERVESSRYWAVRVRGCGGSA